MNRLQNGEILGMVAKGTPGGELRLDGSETEAGIHLRWQMAQELGFPPKGFDLYRRHENYRQFLRCGFFRQADVVGVVWVPYDDKHADAGFTITFSGEVGFEPACQMPGFLAASFSGEQVVRFDFNKPVRFVRITFDERTTPNPVAAAYWQASSGDALVGRERAQLRDGVRRITLFGDRIDSVVLAGENMVICEVCFVLVKDGYNQGWMQTPLNGNEPIYLPVTHSEWVSPTPWVDDQAEAESRLPAALSEPRQAAYAQGFQDELHSILYDLVGTDPQYLHRLKEVDQDSAATLDWPGLSLLQLMAVDPNIARLLGLYWHDVPPSDTRFYDYRLVAHYSTYLPPGKRAHFTDLEPGTRRGTLLKHQGLTYTSPNPMDIVRASWDGSELTALLFTREIMTAPIAIALPEPVKSVTVRCIATAPVAIKYFLGYKEQHVEIKLAGEITSTCEDPDSINKILLLTSGELTLVEIVLRETIGGIGDLIYDVYHVRASSDLPVHVPDLAPPVVITSPTGLDENGSLMPNQSRVGLRWEQPEAGPGFLRAGAPLQFQVQREDLDEDGETVLQTRILNENAPALISERRGANASPPGMEHPMYSDRSVPDGTYTYAVRGVDIFSVLGDWSASQLVAVQDHQAPPPPQMVQAHYLDPADPWLSPEDLAWAEANGPGLKLAWTWPGIFRLQAPDVTPPGAEFRVYGVLGALNRLDGNVTQVITRAGISALYTNIHWRGAADALAGEAIRVNQNFFQVTGNAQGPDCVISVQVLTEPELAPTPGPCSLTFSRGRNYWQDYGTATNWERRLHVEPVQEVPVIATQVTDIADFVEANEEGRVIVQAGAARTVTLNHALDDPHGLLLPGVLLCSGIVYPAYGHTLGNALQVHLVPVPAPGNSLQLIEPVVGDECIYYPGQRYQLYLPGFPLEIPPGQAVMQVHVAMSAADDKTYISDDPVWSRPGRGGLGNRTGNESVLSPAVIVQAVLRAQPAALGSVPPVPEQPIFALPANYYGQARYTLAWDPVLGVAGYAVYRCSGAALFDQDRLLRQGGQAPYAAGNVFADDAGFADWLAEFDPALTEAEMVAQPESHLPAWRAWARRFYPQCSDAKIQELASLQGNQPAFRRLNKDTVTASTFEDTFDGRGQGVYLYRVRTVDAAGNQSDWSPAFPPVHIFDVTPPATPVVTSVTGGEKHVVLRWRLNRETDLHEYRIWRDLTADILSDVRRLPPTAVVEPGSESVVVFVDEGLDGLQSYFYRLAAVDVNGNVSIPTRLLAVRVADSLPPDPPAWERAEWVRLASDGTEYAFDDPVAQGFPAAIALVWLADQIVAEATLERRSQYDRVWTVVTTLLDPLDASDPGHENARRFACYDLSVSTSLAHVYRVRLKDQAGKINTHSFNEVTVSSMNLA